MADEPVLARPAVSFSIPLSRAWERTSGLLFQPFSIRTWLVVGFTAWLAELGARGGSSGFEYTLGDDLRGLDRRSVDASASDIWNGLLEHSLLVTLGALGCLFVLVLVLALLWINSRAKFLFLDNVRYQRAAVVVPWRQFKRQGDSLFFFRIVFFLACLLLVGGLIALIASTVGLAMLTELDTFGSVAIAVVVVSTVGGLVLVLLYAAFFLDAFVVPLMHRYELGALDGWRRFLRIYDRHSWPFLLCGFLIVFVAIGLWILMVAFGFMTCCLGFILLAIPYVSSVVLLPVSVFYRSFTLEFLAQFDPELLGDA